MFFDWSTIKKLIWLRAAGVIGAVWKTITNVAVAVFTAVAAPVRALVIDITPVQAAGTPTPENPLPISGWTGANIVVSPTLDAQDGTTYAVSWQTEAGTVYGGTLEWLGGTQWKLKKTMVSLDMGDASIWTKTSVDHFSTYKGDNIPSSAQIMCSCYRYSSSSSHSPRIYQTGGSIRVADPTYADGTTAEFAAAMTGQIILASIINPVEYTLTIPDSEIRTLLGQNNVWADTGNIHTITYRES